MITMNGINEGASNFVYAIKSYTSRNFVNAKMYAERAVLVSSTYDDILNCFIINLSTLLLIILDEFELKEAIQKLVKIAETIPLISLVWITLINYMDKLDNLEISEYQEILNLPFWNNDNPKTKEQVLAKLKDIKSNICGSYYIKEVILNTCGFDTNWATTMWTLEQPGSFLLTITELTILASKIGPLQSILKPISTTEAYKMINDFVSETSNDQLDQSGTCASCGHCVSTTCAENIIDFDENVKELFSHKNVCIATWHPKNICAPNGSKFIKRGESVVLNYKDKAYNAKVLFQRRGFNHEPGKVALISHEGSEYFPDHPMCAYDTDCPYYTQKHGLYSENNIDYILIKKHDYNKDLKNTIDTCKSSLNFNSWETIENNKLRICLKCKAAINKNKLPETSIAESELPIIPPALFKKGHLIYLSEPNLVEKTLTCCFKANTYIIKLIPSLYQKKKKKTVPGINSLGLENRPDLQKANRGHVMTFKMPMEEIRKKFIESNSIQGPSTILELESMFKYVIMHPTGSKEEAERIAAILPIRHARKHIVKALLQYFFIHHHPRLYPRKNYKYTIERCTSDMVSGNNVCGTLVTIHRDHPDADAARRDINKGVNRGYCETHANAPLTMNEDGFTCSGVLPMHEHSATFKSRLQAAAKNVLATGIITGNAVNEFKENAMLAGIHPWLFYNGRGMQKDINRRIQYSRQQWVNLWAFQHNRKFAQDFSFLFNVKDMYDRHDAYTRARIHIRPSFLVTPEQRTPEKLKEIATLFADGVDFADIIKTHPNLLHIIRAITVSGKHISGSPFERSEFRKPIRALTTSDGTASLWVTINLSDVSSPQLALFTGETITNISLQNKSARWRMIASDAFACVVWFDYFLKKLIDLLLGFNPLSCKRGLFGNPTNHAGCKEGTQRGSTHYHDKLTIKEFTFIRKIVQDSKLRKIIEPSIRNFVDSMLSNSIYGIKKKGDQSQYVVGNDIETEETKIKTKNGQDYASKIMENISINKKYEKESAFGPDFRDRIKMNLKQNKTNNPEVNLFNRINALVETRQMHGVRRTDKDGKYIGRICNATCMKSRKSLLRGNCRFSFGSDGKTLVKNTYIDEEGNIILSRNNSHIVTFSPTILAIVGSNICFDLIKTGRDGTAMDMYLTGYTTKSALTTGRIFSILASEKRKEPEYAQINNIKSFKKMSARWLNLLMGSIDHSQQHVATCLLNIDREIISHPTFQIYTGRFYQMFSKDMNSNIEYCGSYLLENSGNGILRLSCFAEDYALRSNCINSTIGHLSVISFAENIFKRKDLKGYKFNVSHPQYITHSLKFKYKPFKINLLGKIFLSEKHESENTEKFAQCVLLFFKPWLRTPSTLKTHSNWVESLKAWTFHDRHNSDNRWYLKVTEKGIISAHPFIENIKDMFEGKDRAMRQKLKMLKDLKDNKNIDNAKEECVKEINPNNNDEDIITLLNIVNNRDIMYLPKQSIRKIKIADHIKMVTSDVLNAFRPKIKNTNVIIPQEIEFNDVSLDMIKTSWEQYESYKDPKKDICANILTIIPDNHPYKNILFEYTPKDEKKIWTAEQEDSKESNQKFVEFLYSEYSTNKSIRLVDFIVASGASAKQALASVVLAEAHETKLKNRDAKGSLIGIFGKPGTGKSHAFTRIFEPYLTSLKELKTLKKGAFTGSAALNINSFTLHSQLGLRITNDVKNIVKNLGNTNISEKTRDRIKAWIHVLSFMIDEISQVAAILLSQICAVLCIIKENQKIFGNLNMFFFGDFYQMESISPSLFRTLNETNTSKINNNYTIEVTKGRGLWHQLNNVIFLDEPQRSKDKLFSKIKRRIRNGCCQKEDIHILNSHSVQQCSLADTKKFLDAPFFTTRHYEIDYINEKRTYFHALRNNKQIFKWLTPITVKGKKISSNSWIYKMLDEERYTFTQKNLTKIGREFLYCEGIPYKILVTPKQGNKTGTVTSNIGISVGIQLDIKEVEPKNNSCKIRNLMYPPKVIFLQLRKHTLQEKLTGLEQFPLGTVPIFPVYDSIMLNIRKINEKWFTLYSGPEYGIPEKIKIKLFGYKLAPAFANTDYGCQGSTQAHVITNIIPGPYAKKSSSTSAYVILSRAKSLKGILLSCPPPKNCLSHNPLPDLINETWRLKTIEQNTLENKKYLSKNLIHQILDIKQRLEMTFLKSEPYPKWVQDKLQYLTKLLINLEKLLNVPKQVKTCISCLEICLSDDNKPRCFECKLDNISQLESKICSCGKKFSWVQKDGITRTINTCGDCSKKNITKLKNSNSFNWKRKRCLSCSNYTVSKFGKFCYKCDPRLTIEQHTQNIPTNDGRKIIDIGKQKLKVKIQNQCYPNKKGQVIIEEAMCMIRKNNVIPMKRQEINQIYAKLDNPSVNLCFINSAIQFVLSLEPLVDLISCSYVRNYALNQSFLKEFENIAMLMLKNPSETFFAVKLAKEFEILEAGYTFGMQWDCSSVIDLFFTEYEKFIEKLKTDTYKKIAQKKLNSIKTTVVFSTRCKVCSNITVKEERGILFFVPLKNDIVNIFEPMYDDSDVYRCFVCNDRAGNPVPPIVTGATRTRTIKDISKYVLVKLGRVKLNGIDKLTYKVTIPEFFYILGKNLILEAWVQHTGHSVLSGHYVLIRRNNHYFLHMSDNIFSVYENTSIFKCDLCYIAVLKTI